MGPQRGFEWMLSSNYSSLRCLNWTHTKCSDFDIHHHYYTGEHGQISEFSAVFPHPLAGTLERGVLCNTHVVLCHKLHLGYNRFGWNLRPSNASGRVHVSSFHVSKLFEMALPCSFPYICVPFAHV